MTVKPVTVIADVEVKNASQIPTSLVEHQGELSIKVPRQIIIRPVITVN